MTSASESLPRLRQTEKRNGGSLVCTRACWRLRHALAATDAQHPEAAGTLLQQAHGGFATGGAGGGTTLCFCCVLTRSVNRVLQVGVKKVVMAVAYKPQVMAKKLKVVRVVRYATRAVKRHDRACCRSLVTVRVWQTGKLCQCAARAVSRMRRVCV